MKDGRLLINTPTISASVCDGFAIISVRLGKYDSYADAISKLKSAAPIAFPEIDVDEFEIIYQSDDLCSWNAEL